MTHAIIMSYTFIITISEGQKEKGIEKARKNTMAKNAQIWFRK